MCLLSSPGDKNQVKRQGLNNNGEPFKGNLKAPLPDFNRISMIFAELTVKGLIMLICGTLIAK